MLNVQNRIRTRFGDTGFNPRALAIDYLLEYLSGVLFALIVTYHAYLYLLFVTEVLMIVHLASDKRIGLIFHGLVKQEIARSATDGHTLNRAA